VALLFNNIQKGRGTVRDVSKPFERTVTRVQKNRKDNESESRVGLVVHKITLHLAQHPSSFDSGRNCDFYSQLDLPV